MCECLFSLLTKHVKDLWKVEETRHDMRASGYQACPGDSVDIVIAKMNAALRQHTSRSVPVHMVHNSEIARKVLDLLEPGQGTVERSQKPADGSLVQLHVHGKDTSIIVGTDIDSGKQQRVNEDPGSNNGDTGTTAEESLCYLIVIQPE